MYNHGKEHPEVSIVIATRNRRTMLADAVNSVQAQAGVDWELIVVDDASTDDAWDFLSGLHDPRIRCFIQRRNNTSVQPHATWDWPIPEASSLFSLMTTTCYGPKPSLSLRTLLKSIPIPWLPLGHAGIGSLTDIMEDATSTRALCADVIFSMSFYSAGRQYLVRTCTAPRSCGMSEAMTYH